ncbi:MAG TPA: hypothetical protein VE487_10700 [Ilumatobacter sp.]|jgi:hypothetical protein|nr:hypothetical protein [Ilumatobacter sp.]
MSEREVYRVERSGPVAYSSPEAVGRIAVTGDRVGAENLVRSIVMELGASDQLADTFVKGAGFGTVADPHFGRIMHTDEAAARAHLRTVVADHNAVVGAAGLDGSIWATPPAWRRRHCGG